jgi:hypothetical protein
MKKSVSETVIPIAAESSTIAQMDGSQAASASRLSTSRNGRKTRVATIPLKRFRTGGGIRSPDRLKRITATAQPRPEEIAQR